MLRERLQFSTECASTTLMWALVQPARALKLFVQAAKVKSLIKQHPSLLADVDSVNTQRATIAPLGAME